MKDSEGPPFDADDLEGKSIVTALRNGVRLRLGENIIMRQKLDLDPKFDHEVLHDAHDN